MVNLWIAIVAAVLAAVAEWLHARRVSRVARLAFGPGGTARAWTRGAPMARIVGVGAACWGLLTLCTIDGAGARAQERAAPDQHLVIVMDVSPSMYVRDAGPDLKSLRGERARAILRSVFERLDMTRVRVSVVAFYTSAKPVVVDTSDLNVVDNILADLPLEHAFKAGETNMYSGVREAVHLAAPWRPKSTTLVVVSDGDTLPDALAPSLPPSIGDTLVIGVGNPYRTTVVGGHSSRQDGAALGRLAARLGGVYHDGNARHLPTNVLAGLKMLVSGEDRRTPLRLLALGATGVGAALVAAVPMALGWFGAPRVVGRSSRAGRANEAGESEGVAVAA